MLGLTELAKEKYFAWYESFKLLHDGGRQIFEIFQAEARLRIEEGKDDKSSASNAITHMKDRTNSASP